MIAISAMASGAVIGFSIAAPVGPMAILCINRTLTAGIKAGISTGAGGSSVHAVYASVVLLGLQQIQPVMESYRTVVGLVSAGLMLLFAWRILNRKPGADAGSDVGSVMWNYGSAIALSCLNPMLFVLLLGAMGVVIGPEPPLGTTASIVLLGVFLGSFGWWIALSAVTYSFRLRLGASLMQGINRAAAVGMVGFAALSLARVLGG